MQLHQKYAKDGLVAISVSLDDPNEPGQLKLAEKFLGDVNATTQNLVLNEDMEFWQKKFRILGPPAIYVFNREGKWKQFREEPGKKSPPEGHYPEVEKLVAKWLKEK